MIGPFAYSVLIAGLLLAGWAGIWAWMDKPTGEALMIAVIILEVALVVQSALALLRLGSAHLAEPVTFIAYAAGILAPLPFGFQLARIERTKWGSLTLASTALVAAVMTLRLLQIWRAPGA